PAAASGAAPAAEAAPPTAAPPAVRGRVLREVPADPPAAAGAPWQPFVLLSLLACCLGLGGWRYRRSQAALSLPDAPTP
ncbi:protein BatD, partial [Luteimonas sp. Y-2-2-4F]|nr:protein BatD [Luteimonas sp. Y-2-2-4F]